jgi:hypothetical protein
MPADQQEWLRALAEGVVEKQIFTLRSPETMITEEMLTLDLDGHES